MFFFQISCILATCLVAASTNSTWSLITAFYVGVIIGLIISTIIFAISSTESGHSLNGVLKYQCFIHIVLFLYLMITCSVFLSKVGGRTIKAGGVSLREPFLFLCLQRFIILVIWFDSWFPVLDWCLSFHECICRENSVPLKYPVGFIGEG